jgi:uncharacterized protein YjiS (DUF1127 family)
MSVISAKSRSGPMGAWGRWFAICASYWKRREMVKMLRELDDHQLRDIGLMRDQIEAAVDGKADFRF